MVHSFTLSNQKVITYCHTFLRCKYVCTLWTHLNSTATYSTLQTSSYSLISLTPSIIQDIFSSSKYMINPRDYGCILFNPTHCNTISNGLRLINLYYVHTSLYAHLMSLANPIPAHEVETIITSLPTKKAKGPDEVPNELLKLAKSPLSPILANLFNFFLKNSFYPPQWKTAITAIIRKHGKEDYSEPGAYRPIALLSCISKVFESLLTRRIAHWAETNKIIAEGHTGGRRQHSSEDAFIMLTTWIKSKW